MNILKLQCVGLLASLLLHAEVLAVQHLQYSEQPLKVVLSSRQNHITLQHARLTDVVGPAENYNVVLAHEDSMILAPTVTEGKFFVTLVTDSGLVQDLDVQVKNIAPQKIKINMPILSVGDLAKNVDVQDLRTKQIIKYLMGKKAGSKKTKLQKAKNVEIGTVRFQLLDDFVVLGADGKRFLKAAKVEVLNSGTKAQDLLSIEALKDRNIVAGMFFEDSIVEPSGKTKGVIVFRGKNNFWNNN